MENNIIFGCLTDMAGKRTLAETVDLVFDSNLIVVMPEFFRTIREYERGLEFAEILLVVIEQEREHMAFDEYCSRLQLTIRMKMDMLDRLNRVEDYLLLFDELRTSQDPRYWMAWPYDPDEVTDAQVPFIVEETQEAVRLSFMWALHYRQQVMIRKWNKIRDGKLPPGHLRHQQDRLNDHEVYRRAAAFFDRYRGTFF